MRIDLNNLAQLKDLEYICELAYMGLCGDLQTNSTWRNRISHYRLALETMIRIKEAELLELPPKNA